eukprot:TRINITY_DN8458_c0_g1_i1.p2 TRINITY_DN8458_c0_g1~~TRINITY_DN8458_c0_g1_i1.p2  ORF type:complete len:546 (-),score=156.77 TRINITY_DN8458_c0_g1_i1:1819-3219(-)
MEHRSFETFSFEDIFKICESLLLSNEVAIDNVEAHLQQYGYKPPVNTYRSDRHAIAAATIAASPKAMSPQATHIAEQPSDENTDASAEQASEEPVEPLEQQQQLLQQQQQQQKPGKKQIVVDDLPLLEDITLTLSAATLAWLNPTVNTTAPPPASSAFSIASAPAAQPKKKAAPAAAAPVSLELLEAPPAYIAPEETVSPVAASADDDDLALPQLNATSLQFMSSSVQADVTAAHGQQSKYLAQPQQAQSMASPASPMSPMARQLSAVPAIGVNSAFRRVKPLTPDSDDSFADSSPTMSAVPFSSAVAADEPAVAITVAAPSPVAPVPVVRSAFAAVSAFSAPAAPTSAVVYRPAAAVAAATVTASATDAPLKLLRVITDSEYKSLPAYLAAHFSFDALTLAVESINELLAEKHADQLCTEYITQDELANTLGFGTRAKAMGAILGQLGRMSIQRKADQVLLIVKA